MLVIIPRVITDGHSLAKRKLLAKFFSFVFSSLYFLIFNPVLSGTK